MPAITKDDFVGRDYADYIQTYDHAKAVGHLWWVDEIPVSRDLQRFMMDFKHARRDVVFTLPHQSRPTFNPDNYDIYSIVGVAYKEAPELVVGRLFLYSDKNGKVLFCVKSDAITNEKYGPDKEGYHIKQTSNFANAVKNAKTYLKPKMLNALINDHGASLKHAITALGDPARNDLYRIRNIDQPMIEEVENMIRSGYQPATEAFKKAVALIAEKGEELKRMANYKPKTCFVWSKPDRVVMQVEDEMEQVLFKLEDVPDHIRNKVAVLQIAEVRKPIVDVGVRFTDTFFCVFI
jgi:hypothetical protein